MTPTGAIEIAAALAFASALVFALVRKYQALCERERTWWHALREEAEGRLLRFCPASVSVSTDPAGM